MPPLHRIRPLSGQTACCVGRPLEDLSRVIFLYQDHHSLPPMEPLILAKYASCCDTCPTLGDLYWTFFLVANLNQEVSSIRSPCEERSIVKSGLMGFLFHNNRELVLVLLRMWNEGKTSYLHDNLDMERIDL
jgi:hypothetical protein